MRTPLTKPFVAFSGIIIGLLLVSPVFAQEAEAEASPEAIPIPVGEIMVSESIPLLLPAFHDEELAGVKSSDLFDELPTQPGLTMPAKDREFAGTDGKWC